MDLSQKGLLMFFKEYQLDMLKTLWKSTEGLNSRQVWEAVGGDKISRASVINSLDAMVENGLLSKTSRTGKGGHRGIFSPKFDEAGTKQYLVKVFKERLDSL